MICNTGNLYCDNKGSSSVECYMNNKNHYDKFNLIKENSLFVVRSELSLPQSQCSLSSTIPIVTLDNQKKNLNFTD